MTARPPGVRTAKVTPAYGMRERGGFGVRGFRSHCEACGDLSRVYLNVRSAQERAYLHRCERRVRIVR